MDIQEKVQEFGKALAGTPEFEEFYNAYESVVKDEEASRLLNEFQDAQKELQAMQMSGQEPDQERVVEIQH